MPVGISIDIRGVREVKRALRQSRRAVARGTKRALDATARQLRQDLIDQWRGDLRSRKRGFPGQVLKVGKSFVDIGTGRVRRPARVFNVGGERINQILRLQMSGGTKSIGKQMTVWFTRAPRRGARTFVRGDVIYQRGRGGRPRAIGVLRRQVRLSPRWNVRKAIGKAQRELPNTAARLINAELARALRGR